MNWSLLEQNTFNIHPFFGKIMSPRQFLLLERYLHFSDNAAFYLHNHEYTKLAKFYEQFSKFIGSMREISVRFVKHSFFIAFTVCTCKKQTFRSFVFHNY